jgi:hypothetical protein
MEIRRRPLEPAVHGPMRLRAALTGDETDLDRLEERWRHDLKAC